MDIKVIRLVGITGRIADRLVADYHNLSINTIIEHRTGRSSSIDRYNELKIAPSEEYLVELSKMYIKLEKELRAKDKLLKKYKSKIQNLKTKN